jgi:hypothetical protein
MAVETIIRALEVDRNVYLMKETSITHRTGNTISEKPDLLGGKSRRRWSD